MKVQLLLKELFILAVNIYMDGTVNANEFIYSMSMTSVGAVIHNRGVIRIGALIRRKALIRMGALIGIGVLIDKNTLKGGAYLEGALIGRRALN